MRIPARQGPLRIRDARAVGARSARRRVWSEIRDDERCRKLQHHRCRSCLARDDDYLFSAATVPCGEIETRECPREVDHDGLLPTAASPDCQGMFLTGPNLEDSAAMANNQRPFAHVFHRNKHSGQERSEASRRTGDMPAASQSLRGYLFHRPHSGSQQAYNGCFRFRRQKQLEWSVTAKRSLSRRGLFLPL